MLFLKLSFGDSKPVKQLKWKRRAPSLMKHFAETTSVDDKKKNVTTEVETRGIFFPNTTMETDEPKR
jgi:hypothetical protein